MLHISHVFHMKFKVPFLMMIDRVENAIGKHMSWREQVYAFFNSATKEKTWSALLQLKNLGSEDAFDSPELDMVISEVERVENWITCCRDIVKAFVTEMNPLSVALAKINYTLDRSLQIYQGSIDYKLRDLCVCCSIVFEDEELVVCLKCGDRYHRQCSKSTFANANAAKKCICTYCHYLESGAISRNGCLNMISKGKHPELGMLVQLLSSAKNFCVRSEELDMVQKIVERSLACKAFLTEIVEYSLAYQDKDLSPVSDRLLIALKAVALAGVYDQNSSSLLENALAKYSWKIRVKKVLEGSQKPLMQQIQRILKEGLALKIPSADHFIQKLQEVQGVGLRWADNAKKVASDAGELGLDEVFKLINEGENLSVHLEKELKLLRARSELYCICRKPYDQRAMIACDLCNEWYHFDCINLCGPTPKTYHCPACKTLTGDSLSSPTVNHEERSSSTSDVGPHTPPPQNTRKRKPRKSRSKKPLTDPDLTNKLRDSCGIDQLWWRIRKPLRRTSRKRVEFESLSPFFHSQ
ncbi:hypothetical protein GIB67_008340 [Kingdonia uniflora]|uniref:PHD-type domain-containing protein n=1 Tax=Kingdonia uniflora TaxID=39325 RepID=A0A7J7N4T4_9MAGN|nr:hypothetical protein GIB67_008340 [Kingdonia uniflora]